MDRPDGTGNAPYNPYAASAAAAAGRGSAITSTTTAINNAAAAGGGCTSWNSSTSTGHARINDENKDDEEDVEIRKKLQYDICKIIFERDRQGGVRTSRDAIQALTELVYQVLKKAMVPDVFAFGQHRTTTSASKNRKSAVSSTTSFSLHPNDVLLLLRKVVPPREMDQLRQQFTSSTNTNRHSLSTSSKAIALNHRKRKQRSSATAAAETKKRTNNKKNENKPKKSRRSSFDLDSGSNNSSSDSCSIDSETEAVFDDVKKKENKPMKSRRSSFDLDSHSNNSSSDSCSIDSETEAIFDDVHGIRGGNEDRDDNALESNSRSATTKSKNGRIPKTKKKKETKRKFSPPTVAAGTSGTAPASSTESNRRGHRGFKERINTFTLSSNSSSSDDGDDDDILELDVHRNGKPTKHSQPTSATASTTLNVPSTASAMRAARKATRTDVDLTSGKCLDPHVGSDQDDDDDHEIEVEPFSLKRQGYEKKYEANTESKFRPPQMSRSRKTRTSPPSLSNYSNRQYNDNESNSDSADRDNFASHQNDSDGVDNDNAADDDNICALSWIENDKQEEGDSDEEYDFDFETKNSSKKKDKFDPNEAESHVARSQIMDELAKLPPPGTYQNDDISESQDTP